MKRSIRRFTRGRSEYCWTAVTGTMLIMNTGGQQNFPVVVMAADVSLGASQAQATLMRIRGWISAVPITSSAETHGGIMGAAFVIDDDDSSTFDLTQASTFVDEDVLWQDGENGLLIGSGAAGARSFSVGHKLNIDIKARRRLRSGQSVNIVAQTATYATLRVSGAMRALLKLS